MSIDLFSLRMNLQTTGVNNAVNDLRAVESQGVKTAGALDRTGSSALNGSKGFRDLSAAYQNQDRVLGTLAPKIEDNTKKTEAGTEAHKKHAAGIQGVLEPLKKLAEAYLVFEGIHFVRESIEAAASLHELSQKTGASVEMLSVLEFAGRRANVSAGQLSMAFRGLGLSLDGLRDGQKNVTQAFEKIGLTARDFIGLNTDQAFLRIVSAIAVLPDGLEKSEAAARIFGRSGGELIPLLDDLARDGFSKVRGEAEQFGALIGGKMSEDADRLVDQMGDLKLAFQALAREVIPVLIPAMQALTALFQQGPSATWRNTMREIFGAVDGFTRLATFGYFGTDLSAKYRGTGEPEGPSPDRSLGHRAAPFVPPEKKKTRTQSDSARLRELESWEGSPLKPEIGDDLWERYMTGGPGPSMPGRLPNETVTAPQPGGGRGADAANRYFESILQSSEAVKGQFASLGQNLGLTVANGFASALAAGIRGKNPFKAFGNVVLQGLGSIMSQMGQALIGYGITMLKLLPFLSNVFTSGPAAIAAGIALTALGATLGAAATGSGGGGGGGGGANRDITNHITLTADGAGGVKAPTAQPAQHYTIIGPNDPSAQRAIMQLQRNAQRRGF